VFGWIRRWLLGEPKNAINAQSTLTVRHLVPDGKGGFTEALGDRRVVKNKCVTDVFVNLLADALHTAGYLNAFKYHDSGTGVGAEAATDTALGTPCGEARDVGTQTEGASANIYKSVATHTYGGTFSITEHGLFDAATVGNLADRTKFASVGVANGEKIEFTYELTVNSGG